VLLNDLTFKQYDHNLKFDLTIHLFAGSSYLARV
jgi:hypothetical protein